jgi:PHP family Zn ribbon phosphoesterase
MRIIKHGRDPRAGAIHKLKCVSCKTVFEFEAHEAKTVPDDRDGDFYQIACPVCDRLCTKNIDKRYWL